MRLCSIQGLGGTGQQLLKLANTNKKYLKTETCFVFLQRKKLQNTFLLSVSPGTIFLKNEKGRRENSYEILQKMDFSVECMFVKLKIKNTDFSDNE